MTKLDGKTPDLAVENLEKLRQIFPDVFEEGKIDFDKLKQVLGEYVDDEKERYNFTWNGKGKALRLAQTPTTGTLRPFPEEGESKNWNDTQILYIEGDNLEVLKLLQKSYHGKIKMIYIDPPYNTGGDFVYPDDFSDSIESYKQITGQVDDEGKKLSANTEANGRFHTDWLDMMYPRLRLARNLLRQDGVIFISIDDNEQSNLKNICDEIFGAINFCGIFVVNSTPNARDYGHIGKMHEFCLMYSKDISYTETYMLPDSGKVFKYTDEKGGYNIHPLYNSNEAFTNMNRPNLYYPFYLYLDRPLGNNFYEIGLENKPNSVEIFPPKSLKNQVQFVWRWGKEKSAGLVNREIIGYEITRGEYRIVQKMRHDEKIIRSLLVDKKYSSRRGTAETEEILGGKYFSFPKPLALIEDFCNTGSGGNDVILDFFSGSGTTAHAVMQLNAEDGGNRKFIMVQLPEPCAEGTEAAKAGYKNICEIGKERIRRAGEKIKAEIEEQNAQLKIGEEPKKVPDIGFRVFKLDSSNLKQWQPDYENLEASFFDSISNYVEGRSELDVVYEIMLKMGMELTWPLETHTIGGKNVYEIGMGALMICLDDHITTEVAEGMAALYKELSPETWRVVFKDNGFADDSAKVNIKEILKTAGLEEDAFTTV